MMRTLRAGLLGAAGFMVALEILFQCLPVSSATYTGYHRDPLILTYPPRHTWTSSTGWDLRNAKHQRSNNVGFLASRDFLPNPQAVALIGDSYVEASMLDPEDRPDRQLERALSGRPVYGMGGPGTSLLDYAERIRFAREQYGIHDFVLLLETGDLRQSLCGSGNTNGPCLDSRTYELRTEVLPPAGLVKRVARHSALAQYLFGHLMFSPQRLWQQALAQARPKQDIGEPLVANHASQVAGGELTKGEQLVALTFLQHIKRLGPDVRIVIVLDCDRKQIYAGHAERAQRLMEFTRLVRDSGLEVVQLAPIFTAHYRKNGLSFDVGPYDGHFNKIGVQLLSAAAAEALQRAQH